MPCVVSRRCHRCLPQAVHSPSRSRWGFPSPGTILYVTIHQLIVTALPRGHTSLCPPGSRKVGLRDSHAHLGLSRPNTPYTRCPHTPRTAPRHVVRALYGPTPTPRPLRPGQRPSGSAVCAVPDLTPTTRGRDQERRRRQIKTKIKAKFQNQDQGQSQNLPVAQAGTQLARNHTPATETVAQARHHAREERHNPPPKP
jgi:hypothetical protein